MRAYGRGAYFLNILTKIEGCSLLPANYFYYFCLHSFLFKQKRMALVITKRLCSSSLRCRLLPKISSEAYCYGLTTLDGLQNNRTTLIPPQTIVSQEVKYSFNGNIRQFSSYKDSAKENEKKDKDGGSEEKLSLFKKFKQMYRDYWYVLVPVHIVTSVAWLGGFYYLASSGVDIPAMLEAMNFSERIANSMRHSSMGYVAITYGLYKIATPARYAVTLGGTTVSIQYLKKWGYIKPIPSKERLKEMLEETKEGMKEKRENLLESVQNLKESVKETKQGIKGKKDNLVSTVTGQEASKKKKIIRDNNSKEPKPLSK